MFEGLSSDVGSKEGIYIGFSSQMTKYVSLFNVSIQLVVEAPLGYGLAELAFAEDYTPARNRVEKYFGPKFSNLNRIRQNSGACITVNNENKIFL
eukprot:snap_masked-scaffold_6-processed-gene-15.40-mRNA-1 protein AED:1.00 eAED:1.00 QI:0/-1/0/0/-1/1/1/0/94